MDKQNSFPFLGNALDDLAKNANPAQALENLIKQPEQALDVIQKVAPANEHLALVTQIMDLAKATGKSPAELLALAKEAATNPEARQQLLDQAGAAYCVTQQTDTYYMVGGIGGGAGLVLGFILGVLVLKRRLAKAAR